MPDTVVDNAAHDTECDSCSEVIKEGERVVVTPRYVFCIGCHPEEADEGA